MAIVSQAHLDGANLERAQMLGTWIEGSDLPKSNQSEGSYISVRFTRSNLAGARLDRATLTRASFAQANLAGASFRAARLSGADFTDADIAIRV